MVQPWPPKEQWIKPRGAAHPLLDPHMIFGDWLLRQQRDGKIEIAKDRMDAVLEGITLACEYGEAAVKDAR